MGQVGPDGGLAGEQLSDFGYGDAMILVSKGCSTTIRCQRAGTVTRYDIRSWTTNDRRFWSIIEDWLDDGNFDAGGKARRSLFGLMQHEAQVDAADHQNYQEAAATNFVHDSELERLLTALHTRSDEQVAAMRNYYAQRAKAAHPPTEDEVKAFRSDKLVALDRDKAEFCYQLCRANDARRIVEAGTSYGVSTLYLAAAVRDNVRVTGGNGVVVGTEYKPKNACAARAHFEEVGLSRFIDLREGDLCETLKQIDGPVDFMLVSPRHFSLPCLTEIRRQPGHRRKPRMSPMMRRRRTAVIECGTWRSGRMSGPAWLEALRWRRCLDPFAGASAPRGETALGCQKAVGCDAQAGIVVGHRQADRPLTSVPLAQLPARLPRHTNRMLAFLGKARAIDNPTSNRPVPLDRGRHLLTHRRERGRVIPRGLGHDRAHRLVRRLHLLRLNPCRQRLDALALARPQQPRAAGPCRRHPAGMAQHPGHPIQTGRKPILVRSRLSRISLCPDPYASRKCDTVRLGRSNHDYRP